MHQRERQRCKGKGFAVKKYCCFSLNTSISDAFGVKGVDELMANECLNLDMNGNVGREDRRLLDRTNLRIEDTHSGVIRRCDKMGYIGMGKSLVHRTQ